MYFPRCCKQTLYTCCDVPSSALSLKMAGILIIRRRKFKGFCLFFYEVYLKADTFPARVLSENSP